MTVTLWTIQTVITVPPVMWAVTHQIALLEISGFFTNMYLNFNMVFPEYVLLCMVQQLHRSRGGCSE